MGDYTSPYLRQRAESSSMGQEQLSGEKYKRKATQEQLDRASDIGGLYALPQTMGKLFSDMVGAPKQFLQSSMKAMSDLGSKATSAVSTISKSADTLVNTVAPALTKSVGDMKNTLTGLCKNGVLDTVEQFKVSSIPGYGVLNSLKNTFVPSSVRADPARARAAVNAAKKVKK